MPRRKTTWLLLSLMLIAWHAVPLAAAEPTAAQAAINESLALIDANRLEEALESAKRAIKAEPNRVEGHLLYIQLMIQLNRRSEVQRQYTQLKEQHKSGLALMLYGRTLEDLDEQIAIYQKALEMDPGLGWAHYCIASVKMQRGDAEGAIASLQDAIRIQPGFTQGMESLATLYLAMGKTDEAIKTFEQAIEADPTNAKTLFQLGSLLGGKGETDRAVELLEKSLELAPKNPQVMANLAFMYFRQKRYDDALALYDRALEIVPNQSDVRLNREVVARVKKGDLKYEAVTEMERAMEARSPEEAMAHYRRVIEISPDFELPYLALGQLLAASNRPEEAEKALLQAVKLNPGFVEGVRVLAEFYLVAKEPAKAESYLLKAIELEPDQPELQAALGAVYSSTGRAAEAEKAFARAAELLPPEMALPSRLNEAKAIAAQGRLADAARELRGILEINPDFAAARLELAHCYFGMEEFDRARKQYQVLLDQAPDSEELKALIAAVDEQQASYAEKAKTQMRASQILVKTRAEAEAILQQLHDGAEFAALARKHSIGPEATRGGDIGFFKKGELMPELERAIMALEVGEISGVIETQAGYHILKRLN